MRRFILIFASFLLFTACSDREITADNTKQKSVPVRAVKVSKHDLTNTIHLNGQAYPGVQAPLVASAPLTIKQVHVKNGETVKKGQPLITLDDEIAREQVNQARGAVKQLETAIAQAKKLSSGGSSQQLQKLQEEYNASLEKSQALLDGLQTGAVTSLDLLRSTLEMTIKQAQLSGVASSLGQAPQVNITQLESQLSQAKLGLKQAEQTLGATKLTAPMNGIITDLMAVENGIATPGTPLGIVVQMNPVSIVFPVNSYQVTKLKTGIETAVTFDGLEESYSAVIESIPPTANAKTNMFHVTITIPNSDGTIKGGMKATADVHIETIKDAHVIPTSSVLYDEDNQPYVYIVKGKQAIKRQVSLGFEQGENVQVTKGLELGDLVVTDGKERLTDEAEILLKSE